MKEYVVFEISTDAEDTEKELNEYAQKGWRLICSYANNNRWLIVEREKEVCKYCKK